MANTYVINSKNHGPQEFEIRSSKGYGYIFLNGQKVSEGGKMADMRNAAMAYDSELETFAKKWWKKFLEAQRKA